MVQLHDNTLAYEMFSATGISGWTFTDSLFSLPAVEMLRHQASEMAYFSYSKWSIISCYSALSYLPIISFFMAAKVADTLLLEVYQFIPIKEKEF